MNCWKGICTYKNDEDICKKDNNKCDMVKEKANPSITFHKCRYGDIPCSLCYKYITCTET
jgi:hypothetical protein